MKPPVPKPASPDDTQSLGPQAVTGALFSPLVEDESEERTGITLPPKRSHGHSHGRGTRRGAAEREFLAAFLIALTLSAAALLGSESLPGALSATDLLLTGAVLLSGLGLLALGYSARRRGPADPR